MDKPMRRLKIVSNGNPIFTKITDAETGLDIPNVVSIEWKINKWGATCVVELAEMEVDIEVDANIKK